MPTNGDRKYNVYIMGFMGCGKSHVGRILARQLDWTYLDTDEMIVRETGKSIPEIFGSQGESEFRRLEKACIRTVSKMTHSVISLGGGAVLDARNWEAIASSGMTVTLSYPIQILVSRLANVNDRPLLNEPWAEDRVHRIQSLLTLRKPYYDKADLILHFNREVPTEHVASAIAGYLGIAF